jgi:hypothetical protein
VKDIPKDMHDELRRRAREAGMSLRGYVLDLIRRDQAIPSRADWQKSLHRLRAADAGRPAADLIREERDNRQSGRRR